MDSGFDIRSCQHILNFQLGGLASVYLCNLITVLTFALFYTHLNTQKHAIVSNILRLVLLYSLLDIRSTFT